MEAWLKAKKVDLEGSIWEEFDIVEDSIKNPPVMPTLAFVREVVAPEYQPIWAHQNELPV